MKILASGFALLLLVAPASAQNTDDARWNRWTGCWDMVMENAREGTPGPSSRRDRAQANNDIRPQVCIVTTPNGGATFSTRVGTQTPIVQTVIPDGKDRPITEDGCTGTQRAEWSDDGLRLYARAEMTCKTDQGLRRVSGLALIGSDGRWTDVQSIDISGRESYRVRQYRRANGGAIATRTTGTALTLEDVKEASSKVSPRALEAALVETRASFDLTSKKLLDLDTAGVPASVVDLVVALSYPERFVIERTASVDRGHSPIIDDPFMLGWGFGAPIFYDYYYSPYYYSPFAYSYPFYGGGFYGGGGLIVVGVDDLPQQPSGRGRVVDGHGYTRVTPRGAEPGSSGASTAGYTSGGSTVSSSSGGGSTMMTSSGGSSSGGSGGSVSSSGTSSGGSSSSGSSGSSGGGDGGGRTAQPR